MYKKPINNIYAKLIANKEKIMEVLCSIETRHTAEIEFQSAVDCLKGAEMESAYWGDNGINTFAAFMAVNQPLYGLVLGLMSSLAAKETYIRPATDTRHVVTALNEILRLEDDFPVFHLKAIERHEFLDQFVKMADAVYFVGEYANAKTVQSITKPNALFMFSGTGMNPFIVTENADASLAAAKAVEAGLFNSGQDCGRPKVHLLHKDVADEFLEELKSRLDAVICDDYSNPEAQVGPLLRDSVFQDAAMTVAKNGANVCYGGGANLARKMIAPTILKVDLKNNAIFKEFFAPVFTVAVYESVKDLEEYLKDDRYYQNAMYASVFGDLPAELDISKHTIVLANKSLLDVEEPNNPFGGYGKRANFVYDGSSPVARPFLVSEELHKFGNKRKKRKNKNAA